MLWRGLLTYKLLGPASRRAPHFPLACFACWYEEILDEVLDSALDVLSPMGIMRFSSSMGMPGGFRLRQRVTRGHWPPGYTAATRGSTYELDPLGYGVPYQSVDNNGKPLNPKSPVYWWLFMK